MWNSHIYKIINAKANIEGVYKAYWKPISLPESGLIHFQSFFNLLHRGQGDDQLFVLQNIVHVRPAAMGREDAGNVPGRHVQIGRNTRMTQW